MHFLVSFSLICAATISYFSLFLSFLIFIILKMKRDEVEC